MLKAVIFDMDGVIFDSEKIYTKAVELLFKEYKIKINPSDIDLFRGTGSKAAIGGLARIYNLNENIDVLNKKKRELYLKLAKDKLKFIPHVKTLIKQLKKNKIKIALATSARLNIVKKNFSIAKLNGNTFDVIVTKDDIKNPKPSPELFLKAIEKLKIKPNETVIIEDAIKGVEAAKRARTKVIAITTSFSKSKLKQADLIIDSFKQLDIKILEELIKK